MEHTGHYVLGIISAPETKGEELAELIVNRRLAACAQVTGKIKSFYWWAGKVNCDAECLIYLKTTSIKIPLIRQLLKEHHPYEVPEFIVIPVIDGNPDYFHWVDENTAGDKA